MSPRRPATPFPPPARPQPQRDGDAGAQPEATTHHRHDARTDIVVASAQCRSRLGDLAANLDRHLELIVEAERAGADLVVFPELSLTGYFLKDLVPDVALRRDAPELRRLAAACTGIDALVGFVRETGQARFHNSVAYFSGGELVHVHDKVYLPTYGLFDELRYFAAGSGFRSFAAPLRSAAPPRPWRAGVLTCEDMWHPSAAAILARDGVEILLCPSASPARGVLRNQALGSERSYDTMTRTYAQLYTSYVVYCNRVGLEDGVGFWGGSRVVGPDGVVLGEPAGMDETLALHRLDLAAVRRARIANPLLRDERHDVNDAAHLRLRLRDCAQDSS